MRIARHFLAALGAALLASCSLTLFDYTSIVSKHYALVYGVTTYIAPPLAPSANDPNLSFPAADAASVAAMLTQEGYSVTSRWVDGSGNEYVNGVLSGNIATGDSASPYVDNIIADINSLQSSVGPNDVVVFYFSGHGMQDAGTSPLHEYFIPSRGVYYDSATNFYYGDPDKSIRDDHFGALLNVLNTKRKVVILDTCNSGGFIGNTLEADGTLPVSQGSAGGVTPQILAQAISNYFDFTTTSSSGISPYGGAMALTAAGRDESCYEADSPYNHGVMTYYLIQAAQSGDLNHDGHVTVSEVFSLVKAGIDVGWNSAPGNISAGYGFEPHISGGPVDFVLW